MLGTGPFLRQNRGQIERTERQCHTVKQAALAKNDIDRLFRLAWVIPIAGLTIACLVMAGLSFTPRYRSDRFLGEAYWNYNRGQLAEAIPLFSTAIAINPQNAAASPKVEQLGFRATLLLVPLLPPRHERGQLMGDRMPKALYEQLDALKERLEAAKS